MPPHEKKFTLKIALQNMPEGENRRSQVEEHFGAPWLLCVTRKDERLRIHLMCDKKTDEEQKPWTIETKFELRLVSVKRRVKKLQQARHTFNGESNISGSKSYMMWCIAANFMDNWEGDGSDTGMIFCDVTIAKMMGFAVKRQRSFEEPDEHLTDVVLKVGEQQFHVAKMTLAAQSTYFKTLFFENFNEAKKKAIIELNDVDPDVFQAFLELIYGGSEIKIENVENLLKLAEKFDAPSIRKRCEEFLLASEDVSNREKLRHADAFKLENLMNDCLESIKNSEDLKNFLPLNLATLSHSTLVALFEKNLSLC